MSISQFEKCQRFERVHLNGILPYWFHHIKQDKGKIIGHNRKRKDIYLDFIDY